MRLNKFSRSVVKNAPLLQGLSCYRPDASGWYGGNVSDLRDTLSSPQILSESAETERVRNES
ncbi:MAG TPA: hypothetical protein VGN20_29065 [Mucilaginibacter sp.]